MEKTKIQLEFSIFGHTLEPESFSKLIGINATEYWYEGDTIKARPHLKRKETAWNYTIGFLKTLYIDDCTRKFIKLFSNKAQAISLYTQQHNLDTKIEFVIEIWNEERPAIFFERPFLDLVNKLNAEIDIDLYCYTS